ncbi:MULTISPECIES: response regulator transcription factor [unclassified Pseudomonas]|uniref:response regulator transcription factor n=1 Tax=unclassified Pseudomonas TaxID=196821 RepID=UPI002AC98824|nr:MULTISPECIES: response regulator transcription factor [unclassified Pseudomonas]MEB0046822.1 response regulator transcription factor [Pseudomonas sp. Dout3]MEB0099302.1 response regulator transcription factor [Pseudomonas sp. DC1.2]WPX61220.1 response regulator transcription factor [Pseudomonas sp. DC1.2]
MSPAPLKILLVDDHSLFRQGLAALLLSEHDLRIVGQAANGLEALALIAPQPPDLMIIDLEMPLLNGIDTITRAHKLVPALRFLCVSAHGEQRRISAALDAGASGYLLKDCAADELVKAVRTVAQGRGYLSPEIATAMVLSQRLTHTKTPACAAASLSPRERQILQLLVEGLTTRAIADCMHISGKTVSTHREHIMSKLNLKGIAQLTRYALREGWL